MVNIATTREALASDYVALAAYFGICTGSPGSTSTPANEASGGTPAYARVATTWGSPSDNGTSASITGSAVTINAPAGTYDYATLCSQASGAYQVDWASFASQTFNTQGQLVLTPTYSQS